MCLLIVGLIEYKAVLNSIEYKLLSIIVLLAVASILMIPETYGSRIITADDFEEFEAHNAEIARKYRANFNTFRESYSPSHVEKNSQSGKSGMLYSDFLPEITAEERSNPSEQRQQQQQLHEFHPSGLSAVSPHSVPTEGYSSMSRLDDCFYGESRPLSDTFFMWRMWAMFFIFMSTSGAGFSTSSSSLYIYLFIYFVPLFCDNNGNYK